MVNQSDDTVMRIDPVTLSVSQRFVVGTTRPRSWRPTRTWVANFGDGTVTRINIAGNRITQEAIPVGGRPTAIAEGAGGVWVANSADNTVQRIDAKTGVPGAAMDVGEGPDGLLVTEESLWVANGRDGTLSRLGLRSGAVVAAPVPVGSGPRGLARAAGDVWVADQLSGSVTRVSATDRTRPGLRRRRADRRGRGGRGDLGGQPVRRLLTLIDPRRSSRRRSRSMVRHWPSRRTAVGSGCRWVPQGGRSIVVGL